MDLIATLRDRGLKVFVVRDDLWLISGSEFGIYFQPTNGKYNLFRITGEDACSGEINPAVGEEETARLIGELIK